MKNSIDIDVNSALIALDCNCAVIITGATLKALRASLASSGIDIACLHAEQVAEDRYCVSYKLPLIEVEEVQGWDGSVYEIDGVVYERSTDYGDIKDRRDHE